MCCQQWVTVSFGTWVTCVLSSTPKSFDAAIMLVMVPCSVRVMMDRKVGGKRREWVPDAACAC